MLTEINKLMGGMSTMDRYSQTRLVNPESVLEHTGFVVLTSLFIAEELSANFVDVDICLVLKKAALHDIEEVIIGDIATPTKYNNDEIRSEIEKVACSAADKILCDLPGDLYEIWDDSKSGFEGFIVHIADKLAVVYKIEQEYKQFGNKTLLPHLESLTKCLVQLQKVTSEPILKSVLQEGIDLCWEMKS